MEAAGEEEDEEAGSVIVERLSNLREWELYRFATEDGDDVVCKVALRVKGGEVEYGVWKGEEAEPSATGSVGWESEGEWGDGDREGVLREIVGAYEEALPEVRRGVEFEIGEEEDEDEGDEGEWEAEDENDGD